MAAPSAVILLSGGLDSATTLAIARHEGFRCHALSVRYGQRHGVELERAAEIAAALADSHRIVDVDLSSIGGSALTDRRIDVPKGGQGDGIPPTYVPARNTVLLALALGQAEVLGARAIFVGVNAVDYSGYPDCRPAFIEAFERLAALATRDGVEGRPCRIVAPLLQWSKARIIRRALELGVPLERTVSCYDPAADGTPCARCDACRLRKKGFEEAGIPDPAGLPAAPDPR